jgi:uncharacterized membrane protein YsdA (DUF1294 family)
MITSISVSANCGDDTNILIITSLLLILLVLNSYSFLLFRHDKRRAQSNGWRIPENKLLLTGLLGPFGAYWAMGRYRHKTRKLKFKLIPVFVILWIALIIVALYILFW